MTDLMALHLTLFEFVFSGPMTLVLTGTTVYSSVYNALFLYQNLLSIHCPTKLPKSIRKCLFLMKQSDFDHKVQIAMITMCKV